MTISNPASFSSIKAEFGGSSNFKDYYRGGPYVSAGQSSTISTTANGLAMSQFNGVTKITIAFTKSSGATFNPKVGTYNYSMNSAVTTTGLTGTITYSWSIVSSSPAMSFSTGTTGSSVTATGSDSSGSATCTFQCTATGTNGYVTGQVTVTYP